MLTTPAVRAFERVVGLLARALALVAGAGVLLMLLQTVLDVIMGRVFGRPIEGNLEIISVYHMVVVVFLPLALVELRHEHINADLFVRMLPAPARRAIYAFGCLISLGFFGALAWQTGIDAIEAWRIDEVMMGSVYVPLWPAKFALPIGFAAIELAVLLHLLKTLSDPVFEPIPPEPATDATDRSSPGEPRS